MVLDPVHHGTPVQLQLITVSLGWTRGGVSLASGKWKHLFTQLPEKSYNSVCCPVLFVGVLLFCFVFVSRPLSRGGLQSFSTILWVIQLPPYFVDCFFCCCRILCLFILV